MRFLSALRGLDFEVSGWNGLHEILMDFRGDFWGWVLRFRGALFGWIWGDCKGGWMDGFLGSIFWLVFLVGLEIDFSVGEFLVEISIVVFCS